MNNLEIHNQILFWSGITCMGLGTGMALISIGFRALQTAIVGIVLLFVGIILMLLGA